MKTNVIPSLYKEKYVFKICNKIKFDANVIQLNDQYFALQKNLNLSLELADKDGFFTIKSCF